jgi:TRAP-type C4-dicarboxylate transport system substrate-binding protein
MATQAARIRIAGYQDEQSVHTQAMQVMMRALHQKAARRISVEFESNIAERGHKAADLLDLVKSGNLDICYFSSSYLTKHVPALGVFDIPFQFTNRQHTRALLDGSLGAILRPKHVGELG